MRTLLLIMILAMAPAVALTGQNTTRRVPRTSYGRVSEPTATAADTLRGSVCDSLRVAGFEKPLRAMRESMFVTNGSSLHIATVRLTIDYLDTLGRQLHRAVHDIDVDLPAGQTRRVEIPSFDRSGVFYYRASALPRGVRRATTFDVAVTVEAIIPIKHNNRK